MRCGVTSVILMAHVGEQAAIGGAQPHRVDHEVTIAESQTHDFQQGARMVGADGEHARRVVLRVEHDHNQRMPERMFDGFQ